MIFTKKRKKRPTKKIKQKTDGQASAQKQPNQSGAVRVVRFKRGVPDHIRSCAFFKDCAACSAQL